MLNHLKWVGIFTTTGAMATAGFVLAARLLQPSEITFGTNSK